MTSTSPGSHSAAVRGINAGTDDNSYGVFGSHNGSGYGVYGTSTDGSGVVGYVRRPASLSPAAVAARPVTSTPASRTGTAWSDRTTTVPPHTASGGLLQRLCRRFRRERVGGRQPERDGDEELPDRRSARPGEQVPRPRRGRVRPGARHLQRQHHHRRNGLATVQLPAWFEKINTDFRYQLTIVGTRGWNARVKPGDQGQPVHDPDRPAEREGLLAGDRATKRPVHACTSVPGRTGKDRGGAGQVRHPAGLRQVGRGLDHEDPTRAAKAAGCPGGLVAAAGPAGDHALNEIEVRAGGGSAALDGQFARQGGAAEPAGPPSRKARWCSNLEQPSLRRGRHAIDGGGALRRQVNVRFELGSETAGPVGKPPGLPASPRRRAPRDAQAASRARRSQALRTPPSASKPSGLRLFRGVCRFWAVLGLFREVMETITPASLRLWS